MAEMSRQDVLGKVIHVPDDERITWRTPRNDGSVGQIVKHGKELLDEVTRSNLLSYQTLLLEVVLVGLFIESKVSWWELLSSWSAHEVAATTWTGWPC